MGQVHACAGAVEGQGVRTGVEIDSMCSDMVGVLRNAAAVQRTHKRACSPTGKLSLDIGLWALESAEFGLGKGLCVLESVELGSAQKNVEDV